MLDAGKANYVRDHLYERLFQPWKLTADEWPLCKEDWKRVDAIAALPWKGDVLDFGAGDGTLAALVQSRNVDINHMCCVEQDTVQHSVAEKRWADWFLDYRLSIHDDQLFDGALCCEVLEHLTPDEGHAILSKIRDSMKPGAMLCVTVPYEGGSRAEYPGHIRKFNEVTLGNDLRAAGLSQLDMVRIPASDNLVKRDAIWIMATVCVV